MNIYLRATGNWNGNVWSTSDSGPATPDLVPSSSDDVYINTNNTVTLTADTAVKSITHTNGTLSLASYSLYLTFNLNSTGSTARTINMGSGHLTVNGGEGFGLVFSGTNLTFNAGTSLITFNATNYSTGSLGAYFTTGGKTFNDVRINLGSSTFSRIVTITGSPTFRSLIIQSKNSAAHTVQFEEGALVTIDKFVAIGSNSSNKTTINQNASGFVNFNISGSSYGQNLILSRINTTTPTGSAPKYIGSNSEAYNSTGWLLQNTPKISTLVDPMTIAPGSNPNWTTTLFSDAFASQVGYSSVPGITAEDGGYYIGSLYNMQSSLLSTGTYDFTDSELVIEVDEMTEENQWVSLLADSEFANLETGIISHLIRFEWMNVAPPIPGAEEDVATLTFNKEANQGSITYTRQEQWQNSVSNASSGHRWIKVGISGNQFYTAVSYDGSSFSPYTGVTLSNDELMLFKSIRLSMDTKVFYASLRIASINPSLGTIVTRTQNARARIYQSFSGTRTQTALAKVIRSNYYSFGSFPSLPTNANPLAVTYSETDVSNVAVNDDIYTSYIVDNTYSSHQFKTLVTGVPSNITPQWSGKPFKLGNIYMQIYNTNTSSWVTLDSKSVSNSNEISMSGTPSGSPSNYIDSDGYVTVRVYQ